MVRQKYLINEYINYILDYLKEPRKEKHHITKWRYKDSRQIGCRLKDTSINKDKSQRSNIGR